MKKEINIFIVAPKDVDGEREAVREVCNFLDRQTKKHIRIKAISWKQFPMFYKDNPQKSIDKYFNKSDIFVVILWNRLGTIVDGLKGELTKSNSVTGTQYEIESIIASEKESVLFYLKKQEYQEIHIDNMEELAKQKKSLDDFLESIELLKTPTKYGYSTFETTDEFSSLLVHHLSEILRNHYNIHIYDVEESLITLRQEEHNSIISGSYYAGLYLFLVVFTIMIFQITNFIGTYSMQIKQMSTVFTLILLAVVLLAVKALPIKEFNSSAGLKKIIYALLRRGSFIIGLSLLLSVYIWFIVLPLIRSVFY